MKKKKEEIYEVKNIANPKRRLRIVILLLVLAVGFFSYGIISFMSRQSGWEQIYTNENTPISGEFNLQYNLGKNANADFRQVTLVYTDVLKKAYGIFGMEESRIYKNVFYINHNLNKEIEIEPELYHVFERFEKHDNRSYLLAPIYSEYTKLFLCSEDYETVELNPFNNTELKTYFSEILSYVHDSNHVSLHLKGNNRIELVVSDEYLRFAEENGIESFVDFYWYRNAIITDMVVNELRSNGLTKGYITSNDGYAVRLDDSGDVFSTYIYDREDNVIRDVATMDYDKPLSMVSYHSYSLNDSLSDYYYQYSNGNTVSGYVDYEDGLSKGVLNDLVVYSYNSSCLDIVLDSVDCYVANELSAQTIEGLKNVGIYSVFTVNREIYHNDSTVKLKDLFDKNGIKYTLH